MDQPTDPRLLPGANHPPAPLDDQGVRAYLDDTYGHLKVRGAALVEQIDAFLRDHTVERIGEDGKPYGVQVIANDTALGDAGAIGKQASLFVSYGRDGSVSSGVVKERHAEAKKPYLEGGRECDAWFKRLGAPIGTAMERLRAPMRVYLAEKEAREIAIRQAEAKRAADEAAVRQAEAEAAIANAPAAEAAEKLDTAIEATQHAEAAAVAATASTREMTRTYSDHGTVTGLTTTWVFEVENKLEVCRAVLAGTLPITAIQVVDAEVHRLIRAKQAPLRECPGLKIFTRKDVR